MENFRGHFKRLYVEFQMWHSMFFYMIVKIMRPFKTISWMCEFCTFDVVGITTLEQLHKSYDSI